MIGVRNSYTAVITQDCTFIIVSVLLPLSSDTFLFQYISFDWTDVSPQIQTKWAIRLPFNCYISLASMLTPAQPSCSGCKNYDSSLRCNIYFLSWQHWQVLSCMYCWLDASGTCYHWNKIPLHALFWAYSVKLGQCLMRDYMRLLTTFCSSVDTNHLTILHASCV